MPSVELAQAAALWFAGQASDLLRYLILAQLLAFGLEPAVTWLHERRGWRRGSATGLLLAVILLLFALLGAGIGSVLAGQVDQVAAQMPGWIGKLNALPSSTSTPPSCRPPARNGRGRRPSRSPPT
jgi:predicted PurR-regulated permease PerM